MLSIFVVRLLNNQQANSSQVTRLSGDQVVRLPGCQVIGLSGDQVGIFPGNGTSSDIYFELSRTSPVFFVFSFLCYLEGPQFCVMNFKTDLILK